MKRSAAPTFSKKRSLSNFILGHSKDSYEIIHVILSKNPFSPLLFWGEAEESDFLDSGETSRCFAPAQHDTDVFCWGRHTVA